MTLSQKPSEIQRDMIAKDVATESHDTNGESQGPIEQPIRVVLVVDDLGYGGAEHQIVQLANHMDHKRFDVHICALSRHVPLSDRLVGDRNRLHIIEKTHRCDFSVVPRLARLLRTLNVDIVHGYLFGAEIATRLAGRWAGIKIVLGSERNANRRIRMGHRLMYRFSQRYVDAIVANSHAGAESHRRIFRLPESCYRVVHNGVDTEYFKPADGQQMRARLGIPATAPVVGMFANFKKQKNHAMLYRAFKRVLESLPETRLLLVGDAPTDSRGKLDDYRAQLNRLVDELGIRHRCVFLGHRGDTEQLYSACDVTVLSSLHEGTPNVLLESMACGIPVIATRVCDNAIIVKEGQVGYLVEIGDNQALAHRITGILSNVDVRHQMGDRAREWVEEEFSVARLAARTEALYTELLDRKR